MATNLELEALIAASPDEVDGYYVYGDWLEGQGDPRGELVALHAALLRKPKDKTLTRSIEKHLRAHEASLLGELAAFGESLALEWRLGFIVSARIDAGSARDVEDILNTLLHHPSGRFLQSLTIAGARGASPMKPAECVRLLLAARKPTLLKELRLGNLADWSVDADLKATELKATFPRLERSIDVVWRSIMSEISAQRRIDPKFDPAALPELASRDGVDLGTPVDNASVLVGLKVEIDKNRDLGLVAAMRRAFTPASLDRFAVGLGEQFVSMGEPSAQRWGFLAIGLLGHDDAATWIATRLRTWSHQRSVQGTDLLGRIGTPAAIYQVYGMVSDPLVNRPRRVDSALVLERIARARSMDVEALLDRNVPTSETDQALEDTRETTTRRLQRHMLEGRRISFHELRHYFAEHQIVGPLAQRLVWATFDKRDVVQTFRLRDGDNAAIDANDQRITLGDAGIGVLHLAEIEEAKRAEIARSWKKAFERANVTPLFAQMDRPVFSLRDQETGASLTRFKLRSPGFERMRAVLERERDWHAVEHDDHGGVAVWGKEMLRDQVLVRAEMPTGHAVAEVTLVRMGTRHRAPFGVLHPVTVSEILYDLETATTREAVAPQDAAALEVASGLAKGARVRIGGREGRGKSGVVFWIGERDGLLRCGVRTDDEQTHWIDVRNAEIVTEQDEPASPALAGSREQRRRRDNGASAKKAGDPAKKADTLPKAEEAPGLTKGMRVRWKSGAKTGEGTVFWLGEGKFGGGPRAGLKDAETGDTVWAAVSDCEVLS